jgi:NTE family protein
VGHSYRYLNCRVVRVAHTHDLIFCHILADIQPKEEKMAIRTLILSGGGGRGAFHAGVYEYLCKPNKSGVDDDHSGVWTPDIVVGTSIGAVNGAAIVQGISPDELMVFWLDLCERDVEGLPPGMRGLAYWAAKRLLKQLLKPKPKGQIARVLPEKATSSLFHRAWIPLLIGPRWLTDRLIGRWSNLLDTGPLRDTLVSRLKLDPQKIADSDKTLLINATRVHTGEQVVFSNREIISRKTGQPRDNVIKGITINRILASCSIPLIYPWTRDEGDEDGEACYWDGAMVANTPLGAALDAPNAIERPIEEPMEVIVVLMTPWWERGESPASRKQKLPQGFGEAITWTLDWILLASFRAELGLTNAFNELAQEERERQKKEPEYKARYRQVDVIIVAPEDFPDEVTRIIDYDREASQKLIQRGKEAAERAFKKHFGVEGPV